jgi:dipeptidyl aminopeptidase/acylaminoacyl peptidase
MSTGDGQASMVGSATAVPTDTGTHYGGGMSSYRDFWPSMRFQRTLAVSPDGNSVAYVDDAIGQFNVKVQSLRGASNARRITDFADKTVRRLAWHPDGQSLIFLADVNGDENTQLYRIDLDKAEPEQLTATAGAQYTAALGDPFSPDGHLLAYTGNDRTCHDQDVLVRNLKTGEVRRVYAGGGRVYAGYWSPDGTHLTITEWIEGNSDHIVYTVPAEGGPATRLTPAEVTATYWLGPWLPDGSGVLVRSNAGREFTGLGVLDVTTGQLKWLETPDWDVEDVALSGDGRVLVWLVNAGGASQLRARDLTTGADLPVPALPTGVAEQLVVSDDGATVVVLLSTAVRPWSIAAVRVDTGELRWLAEAGPVGAASTELIEPTLVHYSTSDGLEIPAYLYQPESLEEPVGVLISIHGGPVAQERPVYRYDGFYQYLAGQGVAVLAPNGRGSDGYGKSNIQRIYRDWGGGDLQDAAAAVDYLREQSWVDPARIGLYGFSYGGFVVLSCLARLPDLNWAAGVVHSGPSNLVTLANASPPTWRSLVARVIGDPDADAERLLSRSPVTYADHIRAPLFVIQGASDPRVPRQESDQIVQRLRSRGVDVRYDVYSDEGHVFVKTENRINAFSDAADFLVAHLGMHDRLTTKPGIC